MVTRNHFKTVPIITRIQALLVIALISLAIPWQVNADAPILNVTASWSPGTQLTTIDSATLGTTDPGDDLRYVDINFSVTSSVQYWTVELTCTVTKGILVGYTPNTDSNSTADDVPVATWHVVGTPGSDAIVPAIFGTAQTAGSVTFTTAFTTLVGSPIGKNGITTTYPLVTIRLRVSNRAGGTSLSCSPSFLNTDGNPVMKANFVAPPILTVVAGYSITGQVAYQGGRPNLGGIGVTCSNGANSYSTTTNAADQTFSLTTRVQGVFECFYYGNSSTHPAQAPDLYLKGYTYVSVNGSSYNILPVTLLGGNLDFAVPQPGGNTTINGNDLLLITSNYNQKTAKGDINGDFKTDKTDLAILGPNLNTSENVMYGHVIYGLTSGQVTDGSRIWVGRPNSRQITQLIPGSNVDNWPAVSPDGKKMIVTRRLGNGNPYHYALFVMNMDGSNAAQLTAASGPANQYDDFAASWSPDGNQIAFNCSVAPAWMTDDSSLCVIDATGSNFRIVDQHVRFFPPAWLNNNTLVYGGNSHQSVCPHEICTLDISGVSATPTVLVNIPSEMPAITNQGTNVYFLLDAPYVTPNTFTLSTFSLVFVHPSDPTNILVVSNHPTCGYYAVRASLDEFICVNSTGSQFNFIDSSFHTYDVYNLVNNPAWNGTFESSSAIYALRNTVAFVP